MSNIHLSFYLLLIFAIPFFGQNNDDNFSNKKLIECLQKEKVTNSVCNIEVDKIKEKLIKHQPVRTLINSYKKSKDDFQRKAILDILYNIQSKQIVNFMRQNLTRKKSEEDYFYANYLAKTGVIKSLAILNENFYKYPVSSVQWATTIKLFGKYKYRPAIKNMIDSLESASLNVAEAALESLREIFSARSVKFNSLGEAKKYFSEKNKTY